MKRYPVVLSGNGGEVKAYSPDFGVTYGGRNAEEALSRMQRGVAVISDFRLKCGESPPRPSRFEDVFSGALDIVVMLPVEEMDKTA